MKIEIWKDIKGLEGKAMISNLGNVKSLKYKGGNKEIILSKYNHGGYHRVSVGGFKRKLVHRLVAEVFLSNPENKPEVNHINGIKTDNRVDNLEWCTREENMQHRSKVLGFKPTWFYVKGEKSVNAKPIYQYDKEGNLIKKWGSSIDVQRELGIWAANISFSARNEHKTAGGFIWKHNLI